VSGITIDDGNGGGNYHITYANNLTRHDQCGGDHRSRTGTRTCPRVQRGCGCGGHGGGESGGRTDSFNGDKLNADGVYSFTDKNAGTETKEVNVSGITIDDGNGGGNYHITYANNLTSTINVAEITLTTENVIRGYNGDVDAAGTAAVKAVEGQTLFNGDKLNADGVYSFTDKNAGTETKEVNVSGITIDDGERRRKLSHHLRE